MYLKYLFHDGGMVATDNFFLFSSALCHHCLTLLPVLRCMLMHVHVWIFRHMKLISVWLLLTHARAHTHTVLFTPHNHVLMACVAIWWPESSCSSVKNSRCDGKSTKMLRNVLCFYVHSRATRRSDQHQSVCDEPPGNTTNIKPIALHPNNIFPPFKTRMFCRNQTPSSGLQKNICSPSVSAAAAPRRTGKALTFQEASDGQVLI